MEDPTIEVSRIITGLMPLLVGLLTIIGTLMGAWLNNRYTSKYKLKNDQTIVIKELHKRIVKAEKSIIAIQVDYKLNGRLSESIKDEAKLTRDQLIIFYDENAILLPEKVADKIDKFVQHFVLSHASIILNNHTAAVSKGQALKQIENDLEKLRSIKSTLHHEFRSIIGVKK